MVNIYITVVCAEAIEMEMDYCTALGLFGPSLLCSPPQLHTLRPQWERVKGEPYLMGPLGEQTGIIVSRPGQWFTPANRNRSETHTQT